MPRSHIYRVLRTGQVRVNSRRVGRDLSPAAGDRVRIPPMRLAERTKKTAPPLELPVVFEDDALLVVNKPAGTAVHGGSGVSFGVIEQMRAARPQLRFLELAHRLDRETSGLLILAKKRSALTALHAALREGRVRKEYLTLVKGAWRNDKQRVDLPLKKFLTQSGERRVSVDREGRSRRRFSGRSGDWRDFTLLSAELLTGRTHQIRVHLTHLGFPIAGDDKYGDFELNRALAKQGLKRMFLHAGDIEFAHPLSGEAVKLHVPLPEDLSRFLDSLEG